jgi:hypothetical protein
VSAFERAAVQRVIDRVTAAGGTVPPEVTAIMDRLDHGDGGHAARTWAREHPASIPCCEASAYRDLESCTCWVPVFDVDQQPARPIGPGDLMVRPGGMCSDCAYRPGSPERVVDFTTDQLRSLPAEGTPFYCHDGIRRPAYWVHPEGRRVEGDPADYQPLVVRGAPYRADGRVALLCAGWAGIAARSG